MIAWEPAQLETVACDNCGSQQAVRRFARPDGLDVSQCATCGLAFLQRRPRPELVAKFYEQDYFTGDSANSGIGGLRPSDQPASIDTRRVPREIALLQQLGGDTRSKDLIEIGCATGALLVQLQPHCRSVQGIELSDYASGQARQRGLPVFTGTVDDFMCANPGRQADIVLAFEVIEHVLSPSAFLAALSSIVRPGGLLLLSTPNFACTRRYGSEWKGLHGSFEHLYFFDPRTLAQMAARHGFVSVHTESTKYLGGDLTPRSGFDRLRERLKTLRYFLGEIGVINTLQAITDRQSPIYRHGIGHTLLMGFRRKTTPASE
jgi:2-polyprenyl-3-methyl-5-hydroxy-6-metoxy-1,4-benzoquinol methylase